MTMNQQTTIHLDAREDDLRPINAPEEMRRWSAARSLARKIADNFDRLMEFRQDDDGRLRATITIIPPTRQ